jgi:serine/threonine protein kinase
MSSSEGARSRSPKRIARVHVTADARARDARRMLDHAWRECEGKARARRARASARGEDEADDERMEDLHAIGDVVRELCAVDDGVLMRSTLGCMDGFKAALRAEREDDDEARREICVAALFGLSKLATTAREQVIGGDVEEDVVLEMLRVQCKAPNMRFSERARAMSTYVKAVGVRENLTNVNVRTPPASPKDKSGRTIGGLARAFASQQEMADFNTPDVSDDEGTEERRQSMSSLCASPSRIFYSPKILSGDGTVVDEAITPPGTVICRICEQPVAKRTFADHNATCAGFRPSSLGSSGCASARTSASLAQDDSETSDQMSIDDFRIIKLISGGAYGRVFLAQKRATGDLFAVKALRKRDLVYKNMMDQVVAERDALIAAANPFTIKLYYSFTSARHVYLVTEYANGGDLYSLLTQLGRLSEEHARQYCAEIALALEYVHSKGITHRDLKPGNCLIASDGHIKLADFGLSRIDRDAGDAAGSGSNSPSPYSGTGSPMSPSSGAASIRIPTQDPMTTNSPIHRMTLAANARQSPTQSPSRKVHRRSASRHASGAKGTPDYLAPEILLCEPCGEGVDWWALGVMAYEMLVGVPPFNASTPLAIFARIINGKVEWPGSGAALSDESKDFVNALLVHDVEARLGSNDDANDIKAHPWFADVTWEHVYDKSAASVFVPKPESRQDTSYFVPASDLSLGVEYPVGERRMSESHASEDSSSMKEDVVIPVPTPEEVDEIEDCDEEKLREFTYKNLAELAMRNMRVSGGSVTHSAAQTSGLPRRGSVGKDLAHQN